MPIAPSVQELTKLSLHEDVSCYDGKPVDSCALKGFERLISFLNSNETKVSLIAHNGRVFDYFILLKGADSLGFLTRLERTIQSFVDTLP